jgi:hypothetical protein
MLALLVILVPLAHKVLLALMELMEPKEHTNLMQSLHKTVPSPECPTIQSAVDCARDGIQLFILVTDNVVGRVKITEPCDIYIKADNTRSAKLTWVAEGQYETALVVSGHGVNVRVEGFKLTSTTCTGMRVTGRANVVLKGVDVIGCGNNGIGVFDQDTNVELMACTSRDNGRRGLMVMGGSRVTLRGSSILPDSGDIRRIGEDGVALQGLREENRRMSAEVSLWREVYSLQRDLSALSAHNDLRFIFHINNYYEGQEAHYCRVLRPDSTVALFKHLTDLYKGYVGALAFQKVPEDLDRYDVVFSLRVRISVLEFFLADDEGGDLPTALSKIGMSWEGMLSLTSRLAPRRTGVLKFLDDFLWEFSGDPKLQTAPVWNSFEYTSQSHKLSGGAGSFVKWLLQCIVSGHQCKVIVTHPLAFAKSLEDKVTRDYGKNPLNTDSIEQPN